MDNASMDDDLGGMSGTSESDLIIKNISSLYRLYNKGFIVSKQVSVPDLRLRSAASRHKMETMQELAVLGRSQKFGAQQ